MIPFFDDREAVFGVLALGLKPEVRSWPVHIVARGITEVIEAYELQKTACIITLGNSRRLNISVIIFSIYGQITKLSMAYTLATGAAFFVRRLATKFTISASTSSGERATDTRIDAIDVIDSPLFIDHIKAPRISFDICGR